MIKLIEDIIDFINMYFEAIIVFLAITGILVMLLKIWFFR